jgi:hypothetical protein
MVGFGLDLQRMRPMPQDAAPMQGHALFRTHDLDEARARVAAVFCPHRLDRIGKGVADGVVSGGGG